MLTIQLHDGRRKRRKSSNFVNFYDMCKSKLPIFLSGLLVAKYSVRLPKQFFSLSIIFPQVIWCHCLETFFEAQGNADISLSGVSKVSKMRELICSSNGVAFFLGPVHMRKNTASTRHAVDSRDSTISSAPFVFFISFSYD